MSEPPDTKKMEDDSEKTDGKEEVLVAPRAHKKSKRGCKTCKVRKIKVRSYPLLQQCIVRNIFHNHGLLPPLFSQPTLLPAPISKRRGWRGAKDRY
jgi:hypothetical protein